MASVTIPCTKCASKGVGIFKCQGCSNVFCRKHASEHRDSLSHQLDELVSEHDQLYQLINQENNGYYTLINQIDQWEKNSIIKIQQVAQNIRRDIGQYIKTQKETASETLKYFSQRLRKAREEDDYVENDLYLWTLKLENLKKDLTTINSSIIIREDSKDTLISNIYLSSIKQQQQQMLTSESFLRSVGDIHIEDNGQLAMHGEQKRSDAFLCGKNEYTRGKHKIRFIINKKNSDYITTFGIASMESQLSVYGWSSDDQTVGGGYSQAKNIYNQRDMKGETILQIELLIDCDNRKISYFNERTRCTKEMNVDLDLCPFPWQLYFYLYDTGDRVRLLTLNQI
ncbi:unnamed protein product [Rotaria sp. Silwood2]|nr:unnamed protein product [Rotaria sp. Silwood2]CAF4539413.1 unnamed protein product [Rotaria sp. Silwood2]